MSVIVTPDSEYGKEKVKWEAHHTAAGPPGRPYEYRPLPAMLFKAGRIDHGPLGIIEQVTVTTEGEREAMLSRGFHIGPLEAIKAKEAEQLEHAKLGAEMEYDVEKRLSEKAKQQVRVAQSAHGSEHMPMMPETPIKRPVPASDDTLNRQKANQAAKAAMPVDESI